MTAGRPRPSRRARAILTVLVLTWLAAFTATHLPKGKVPTTGISDKRLHAAGYFLLAGAFVAALAARGVDRSRRVAAVVVTLALYGALDEVTQELPLINRHASFGDWLADMAGTAAAVIVCELALVIGQRLTGARKPGA
jgi:VanZ family protein